MTTKQAGESTTGKVYDVIARHPGNHLAAIAETANVSPGCARRAVDQLVRDGLVRRTSAERAVTYTATSRRRPASR